VPHNTVNLNLTLFHRAKNPSTKLLPTIRNVGTKCCRRKISKPAGERAERGGVVKDEKNIRASTELTLLLFHSIRIRTFFARRSFEREILTLKHKLGQSLEGARHAETYKSAMNEARLLSEKLQGQNVELKKKNTDLLKKKNASTAAVGAAPKGGGKESIEELLKQNADVRRKVNEGKKMRISHARATN